MDYKYLGSHQKINKKGSKKLGKEACWSNGTHEKSMQENQLGSMQKSKIAMNWSKSMQKAAKNCM